MNKINELEHRWKAYKYKTAIFYLFIVVLIAFLFTLGLLIKVQLFDSRSDSRVDSRAKSTKAIQASNPPLESANQAANPSNPEVIQADSMIPSANQAANQASNLQIITNLPNPDSTNFANPAVNFECRQVMVSSLNVRERANLRAKVVGTYGFDAIFCASDEFNNMLKTPHGWVSASNQYSQIVDVNMFVDTGFRERVESAAKAAFDEVKIVSPHNLANADKSHEPQIQANPPQIQANPAPNPVVVKAEAPKPKLKISSSKTTQNQMIEFKKSDFRNSNSYEAAIEVARHYFQDKDYENSIRWALNASNADSKGKQKTESFIIYAKSLYATGKHEQAFEVLSRYVSSTNSQEALDALNKLKQGII